MMVPKNDAEWNEAYQSAFKGVFGPAVLNELLDITGYWVTNPYDDPATAEAKRKIGTFILRRLGVFDADNRDTLVSTIIALPPVKEPKNE